jgi:hypothetical protein
MGTSGWHLVFRSLLVSIVLSGVLWGCSHFDKPDQVKPEDLAVQKESKSLHQIEKDGPPHRIQAGGPTVEVTEAPRCVHEVQWPGENLSLIAKWYTGSSNNWGALAKFNPKLNPNLIHIGDKIVIPQSLLQREEPMPRSFLSSPSPEQSQKSPSSSSPSREIPTDPPAPEKAGPKGMLYAPI